MADRLAADKVAQERRARRRAAYIQAQQARRSAEERDFGRKLAAYLKWQLPDGTPFGECRSTNLFDLCCLLCAANDRLKDGDETVAELIACLLNGEIRFDNGSLSLDEEARLP